MKEIKRYTYIELRHSRLSLNTEFVEMADHKAVVETMQKEIDDLLLVADHRWDKLKESEKRIDELEAERDNDKQVVETYRNRLYKKGLPTTTLDNNKV